MGMDVHVWITCLGVVAGNLQGTPAAGCHTMRRGLARRAMIPSKDIELINTHAATVVPQLPYPSNGLEVRRGARGQSRAPSVQVGLGVGSGDQGNLHMCWLDNNR